MAETTKTATTKAAKQATHAAKNVEKAAELAPAEAVVGAQALLRGLDAKSVLVGTAISAVGFVVGREVQTRIRAHKLQKEIDKATETHESRESRA